MHFSLNEIRYNDIGIIIFHGLGDIINCTILADAVRKKYPNRKITIITSKKYQKAFDESFANEIIGINGNPQKLDKLYKTLKPKFKLPITPTPSICGYCGDTLLEHWKNISLTYHQNILNKPHIPITKDIIDAANCWLNEKVISNNFIIIETKYSSAQSWWTNKHTNKIIKILSPYFDILFVNEDPEKYQNKKCIDARLPFRWIVPIFNKSKGFIGVSSSLSLMVNSNEASNFIPCVECVRGKHWSTYLYTKKNKIILYNENNFDRKIKKHLI
ncbi:MAG: hypothetical protein ACOC56_04265 [Atribacterota bacterium]